MIERVSLTDISIDPLESYLQEAKQHQRSQTREEQIMLGRKIEAGKKASQELSLNEELSSEEREQLLETIQAAEEAKSSLIEANLFLVVWKAKKYMGRGLAILDLIQEGNIGLMTAAEQYDWRRGYRFSTYAFGWIRATIIKAIEDQARTVRLPVPAYQELGQIEKTYDLLTCQLGRWPTDEEIAQVLGINKERVEMFLSLPKRTKFLLSLDQLKRLTPFEDHQETLADSVKDPGLSIEERVEQKLLSEALQQEMEERLTHQEITVLRALYGVNGHNGNHTYQEIGAMYNLTRNQLGWIKKRALKKLRCPEIREKFQEYL